MSDDRLYLTDILERIDRIEGYTQVGRRSFLESPLIQDAVIRNFEVMGEAVKQLSSELRQRYPEVRWRQIAGFRDVLIHNYMGLDLVEVWNVIERDLPNLKHHIEKIRNELERKS